MLLSDSSTSHWLCLDVASAGDTAPWAAFLNRDQLVSLAAWTLSSYSYGAWYMRRYAPHLFKVLEYTKTNKGGAVVPVVRSQFFLLWTLLLTQGLLAWMVSVARGENVRLNVLQTSRHTLWLILKDKFLTVRLWVRLAQQAALVYPALLLINWLIAGFGYPLFSEAIRMFIDVQAARHISWFAFFRIGLLVHAATFAFFNALLGELCQTLLDFFLGRVLKTSSLAGKEAESCLALGITATAHPYIHYQALAEFESIVCNEKGTAAPTTTAALPSDARRKALFQCFFGEDDSAVSRVLLEWFVVDLKRIHEHIGLVVDEFTAYDAVLEATVRSNDASPQALSSSAALLFDDESSPLQKYREKTTSLLELVSRRILGFDGEKKGHSGKSAFSTAANVTVIHPTNPPVPDVFAPRLGKASASQNVLGTFSLPDLPTMAEFAPYLLKMKRFGGGCLISTWIAARLCASLGHFEARMTTIRAMTSFIVASYEEDEQGQVQQVLPRVLAAMMSLLEIAEQAKALPRSERGTCKQSEDAAVARMTAFAEAVREALLRIRERFGDSLRDAKLPNVLVEKLKSL
jgi:hypothetical protein